jgi:hypothetical protein
MKNYLRIVVSAYLAVVLYAGLSGDAHLWSVNHLALLPQWLVAGLFVVGLILIWGPSPLIGLLQRIATLVSGKLQTRAAIIGGMAVAASMFVLFRSRNHLLGDGYVVLSNITSPDVFVPTEILDVLSHRFLYYVVGDPELSYLILSIASGILFLTVVCLFTRRLTQSVVGRIAAVVIFLGLAQMQFFFGYAENYTVMTAVTSLFMYLGWRNALDDGNFLWAVVAFVFAGLFHLSAWCLLPGLCFLFMLKRSRTGKPIYAAAGVLTLLLALASAVFYYTQYEGEQIFAPILASEINPYTMLSSSHLLDIVNISLLVAPLPLIAIVGVLLLGNIRGKLRRPEVVFLALSALGALLFAAAVDPKLGAIRDWDLLSLFGIPVAFFAAHLIVHVMSGQKVNKVLAGAGLAVILVNTVPWIASNTEPVSAKEKIKSVIASDVHYSPAYYDGYRLMSWADLLSKTPYCDYEEAARACSLRVLACPDDYPRYIGYAKVSFFIGNTRQASEALAKVDCAVLNARWTIDLMRMHLRFGQVIEAEWVADIAIKKFPDHKVIQYFYLIVSQLRQQPDKSLGIIRKMLDRSPDTVGILSDGIAVAIFLEDHELATAYLEMAEAQPTMRSEERADIRALKRMLAQKTGLP